ncbi:SRPBCC family protein [Geodermatophilus sp. SYSU D00742]
MTDERTIRVSRDIAAPPERVFALLADPARHTEIDGAGMLRGLESGPSPVTGVGDAFVMRMDQEGIGEYRMRNEVVDFEPDRRIAWAPAIHPAGSLSHVIGDLDPSGHTWGWELEAAPGGTRVSHTYDWSGVRDERALGLYPRVSAEQMEETLDRLAAALA